MDLVDEQAGPLAVVLEAAAGDIEHLAHLLDTRRCGGEFDESALRLAGDDLGEGRLADPRRTVEDHRADPVRLDEPPQEPPGLDGDGKYTRLGDANRIKQWLEGRWRGEVLASNN